MDLTDAIGLGHVFNFSAHDLRFLVVSAAQYGALRIDPSAVDFARQSRGRKARYP
jgi:hypothetical protein